MTEEELRAFLKDLVQEVESLRTQVSDLTKAMQFLYCKYEEAPEPNTWSWYGSNQTLVPQVSYTVDHIGFQSWPTSPPLLMLPEPESLPAGRTVWDILNREI